jgi:hypothetical protein
MSFVNISRFKKDASLPKPIRHKFFKKIVRVVDVACHGRSYPPLLWYSQFCNCRYMGWYRVSHNVNVVQKKSPKNTVFSTYPVPVEIYGIPYMKKVTEFREILRNFTELYHTKFSGIPRNFSQFRAEYGIDRSKKNRRNYVSTEFRGHPTLGTPPPPPTY